MTADSSDSDDATTSIPLPKEVIDQIRPIARAHDRSLSAELRVALLDYVERNTPRPSYAEQLLEEKEPERFTVREPDPLD
jgi:predicted transcriptional regulator